MRTIPAYGKGVSFPFRIDRATGKLSVSAGSSDSASVSLAYLNESWTVREVRETVQNLIAESIAHIVLTRKGEHDTLPDFGSNEQAILFENNAPETKYLVEYFFHESTKRWEHRAVVPERGGVSWPSNRGRETFGQLPVQVFIEFIDGQVTGNLVAPFVSVREARQTEYPATEIDSSGHDYYSRYFHTAEASLDGTSINRIDPPKYIAPAYDDYFYKVKYGDNWLTIAWSEYGDIRHWHIPAQVYVQDAAEQGLSSDVMYPAFELEMGQRIRMPSLARVQTQLSTERYSRN